MTSYYDNFLVCISEALKGIEITTRSGERLEPEEGFSRLCRFSEEIRNAGHTQFLCGNGASSSFANHMALDWTKNGHVRTLAFSDSALLTAMGDDFAGDEVFAIESGIEKFFQGMLELQQAQKKTDEQLNRTDEQLSRTIRKLDDIGRQLGDLGLVQGEVAEELFYRNVESLPAKVGRHS
jgi:hypothetical protein